MSVHVLRDAQRRQDGRHFHQLFRYLRLRNKKTRWTRRARDLGHFDNLLGHQEIQDPQGVCNVFNNLRNRKIENLHEGAHNTTHRHAHSHTHNQKHTQAQLETHTQKHREAQTGTDRHTIRPKQRSRKIKSRKNKTLSCFSFFISFIFRFGEVEAFDSRREEGGTHLDI